MCELSALHTGSILHALGDVFRYHQATPICYSKRIYPTFRPLLIWDFIDMLVSCCGGPSPALQTFY